jgi:hypothetical protein
MAKASSAETRKAREHRTAAALLRMQQDIDRARGEIWMRHAGATGRGMMDYCAKFNEAWRRSCLQNSERDDMTTNGNYIATGRDINGYDQDELEARARAAT